MSSPFPTHNQTDLPGIPLAENFKISAEKSEISHTKEPFEDRVSQILHESQLQGELINPGEMDKDTGLHLNLIERSVQLIREIYNNLNDDNYNSFALLEREIITQGKLRPAIFKDKFIIDLMHQMPVIRKKIITKTLGIRFKSFQEYACKASLDSLYDLVDIAVTFDIDVQNFLDNRDEYKLVVEEAKKRRRRKQNEITLYENENFAEELGEELSQMRKQRTSSK